MTSHSQPGPRQGRSQLSGSRNRVVASSPPRFGPALRTLMSTPVLQPGGYSASPQARTLSSAHRSNGSISSRSEIYTPRLPAHPLRQGLLLRPASVGVTTCTSRQGQANESDDEHGSPEDDPLDADVLSEVIMAIDMSNPGTLGCAYYIAAEERLLLLEDVPMAGKEIIETVLLHAKPTTVLVPARASQLLLDVLYRCAEGADRDDRYNDWSGAYVLRTAATAEFKYDSAMEKLLTLTVESPDQQTLLFTSVANEPVEEYRVEHGSTQGSLMRLGTLINLDSHLTTGCAGAVLSDLNRRRTAEYLPGDPDAMIAFKIKSLEMFKLFDSLFVNADTLASLQILQSEFHPNSQMRGPDKSSSGAKEDLSVYGLFHNLACTPQGKYKLRQIFLRPSTDANLINDRQRIISFFLRPYHSDEVTRLTKDLRRIKNMRTTIAFLQKGVDSPGKKSSMASNVWLSLQRFARNALSIRETLAQMQDSIEIQMIRKVVDTIEHGAIHHIGELITRTVDFGQSRERQRTAVKQGIDADLDELKRRYHGMEDFLTEVNIKLRAGIPQWAQQYIQGCVFYPQLGFLTVVSLNPETGNANYEGEGMNDTWERMFVDNSVVYCKNRRMKEMDEHFGDAYCMIIDREIEILHELSTQVLKYEDAILAASDVLGELDSLFALAIGSKKYNWVAPAISHENILQITGGRHPLQELVVPSFVENDCYMLGGDGDQRDVPLQKTSFPTPDGTQSPSTLILTGPNHSGKSVYLKQVALIVYLAHIGCYVPAEKATIGITDQILTRIATRESVSRNESAFAIDLRQAAFAINLATRKSLILVDEFGKGTNTVDGAGLMTALLRHFSALGAERPKLLAATHFHEIFEASVLTESQELAFAHMDVQVDFATSVMEDQVTYLYRLQPGRSVSSFGSRCAAMNGVDQAIVDRAELIMLLLVRGEDLEAACSKLSREEELKLQKAESVARHFLEQEIDPPNSSGKKREGYYRTILQEILGDCEDLPISDAS